MIIEVPEGGGLNVQMDGSGVDAVIESAVRLWRTLERIGLARVAKGQKRKGGRRGKAKAART